MVRNRMHLENIFLFQEMTKMHYVIWEFIGKKKACDSESRTPFQTLFLQQGAQNFDHFQ